MYIEVTPATAEQEPILANLLELYAHDFSEFSDLELGPDGRFGYRDLCLYWSVPNRHPFLIQIDGRLAGLILVKKGSAVSGRAMRTSGIWPSFFVAHGYRRRGIGAEMARKVWRRIPGRWEVRVMESNASAYLFWEHAVTKFTGKAAHSVRFEKDGKWWRMFTFGCDPEA